MNEYGVRSDGVLEAMAFVNAAAPEVKRITSANEFFSAWKEALGRDWPQSVIERKPEYEGEIMPPYESELIGLLHVLPGLSDAIWKESFRLRRVRLESKDAGGDCEKDRARARVMSPESFFDSTTEEDFRQDAVNLFCFLAELADYGNTKTMAKYGLVTPVANIFNKMLRSMYNPEQLDRYPIASPDIATIIMRYLGAPNQQFPTKKSSADYLLYEQVTRSLVDRMWGCWADDQDMHFCILRALDRTGQLSMLLEMTPKIGDIIPAFVKYAEQVDEESYGDFCPDAPNAFLQRNHEHEYSARRIGMVMRLIKLCYWYISHMLRRLPGE